MKTAYQHLSDKAKAVLRGKFTSISKERTWIYNLTLYLKFLEKEEKRKQCKHQKYSKG